MSSFARGHLGGLLLSLRMTALAGLLGLAACGTSGSNKAISVSATTAVVDWSVTVFEPPEELTQKALNKAIDTVVRQVHTQVNGPDSALKRFNQAETGQWVAVPAAFAGLVQQALALGRATIGAYDVTRRSVLALWGVAGLSDPQRPPSMKEIYRARQHIGIGFVSVRDQPPALRKAIAGLGLYIGDLLAAYRARLLAQRLVSLGAENWRIRFGDTVLVSGSRPEGKPYEVVVPTPERVLRLALSGHDAVASATVPSQGIVLGRRRYSAVIDPRTARPVAHWGYSVTVIAGDAVRASALARALLVMGPDSGRRFANARDIAALFVRAGVAKGPTVLYSKAFKRYLAGGRGLSE